MSCYTNSVVSMLEQFNILKACLHLACFLCCWEREGGFSINSLNLAFQKTFQLVLDNGYAAISKILSLSLSMLCFENICWNLKLLPLCCEQNSKTYCGAVQSCTPHFCVFVAWCSLVKHHCTVQVAKCGGVRCIAM